MQSKNLPLIHLVKGVFDFAKFLDGPVKNLEKLEEKRFQFPIHLFKPRTESEDARSLEHALRELQSVLPARPFGQQGSPQLIMTDDADALRGALRIVFPQSRLLLCSFHVLQAI